MCEKHPFNLNTGQHCFMCFQKLTSTFETAQNPVCLSSSLFSLCHHLEIDIREVFRLTVFETFSNLKGLPPSSVKTNVSVPLCSTCSKIHSKLNELLLLQEKVKLEIKYWMERLHTRLETLNPEEVFMNPEDQQINKVNLDLSQEIRSLLHSELAKELRSVLKEKCKTKTEKLYLPVSYYTINLL